MAQIRSRNDRPVYLDVAEAIRRDILSRRLAPGDQVATYSQLAERFGVAIGTVQKAMKRLAAIGAVAGRPRRGTVVVSLGPLATPIPYADPAARNRRASPTGLVGMITTDIASGHFYAEVIRGVQDALSGAGYDLVIANSDEDPLKEAAAVERLLARKVDGLILDPVVGEVERGYPHTRRLLGRDLPVVLVDKCYDKLAADSVTSDNMEGAYRLTRRMLEQGHRRIAFIAEPPCSSVLDREKGFRNAVAEAGLTGDSCKAVGGDLLFEEAGVVHGRRLLDRDDDLRPSAIFACNDRVARGVYEVCSELGIVVGEDLAVAGYDGLPFAETMRPALTTVVQPRYEMGFEAGRLLVDRIENGRDCARTIVVTGRMVLRGSVGCVESAE